MASETAAREQQEKQELAQRVADSARFRHAPRLREFLLFVTERALTQRSNEISEQALGREVFHRPESYDTTNDNIVRVTARQVRVKLKEYADNEGCGDSWVLEIPKGGYVPVFSRREEVVPKVPDPTRGWKLATVGLALLAVALSLAVFRREPRGGVRPPAAPLSDLVIRPGQRTVIVMTDSSLVLLHELTGRMMSANEYESRQYPLGEQRGAPEPFVRHLTTRRLLSLADLSLAMGLIRRRPDAEEWIQVVHARDVGPRNFKDNNVILMGGARSNPWTGLFEERLNFRFVFSDGGTPPRVVNSEPQAGELAAYEPDPGKTRAFARIALVPNLNHTGRVLLLSGTTIEATEAASEFFLNDQALETLRTALGRDPSGGKGFEVLLETNSIGGTARSARIIAHRQLP
ncbi:MAG: hypothetical protein K2X03_20200 [Bryobacteraceae bacterium]|nr:hypothetical protein [Bryobacteraceae bacterium]